jgi:hypothetical protein
MGKIKIRRQASARVYPHNDMRQAAHHFKTKIDQRLAAGDRAGIYYDMLSEFVFLAFAVEAQINFLGDKLVSGWKEKDYFDDKFRKVLKQIDLKPDWNKRPFSTARVLKELRNGLAHSKPQYRSVDEIVVVEQDEADDHSFADLKGDWQKHCESNFYQYAYDDVDTIWQAMLKASGLQLFDTMTGAERSTTFIEHVPEEPTGA